MIAVDLLRRGIGPKSRHTLRPEIDYRWFAGRQRSREERRNQEHAWDGAKLKLVHGCGMGKGRFKFWIKCSSALAAAPQDDHVGQVVLLEFAPVGLLQLLDALLGRGRRLHSGGLSQRVLGLLG